MIIIGIVILSLVVLTSAGLFSVVFTPTDFELSVTSYVPRGGSGTNNKLIGTFDESAEFDLTIVNSVHPEDFIIKIVDESGDSKIIFSQEYSPVFPRTFLNIGSVGLIDNNFFLDFFVGIR